MTPPCSRRALLAAAGAVAAGAVLPQVRAAEAAAPALPKWKTAVGMNGFQSASAKYRKSFPHWEVLDFARLAGFDGAELAQMWPAAGTYPRSDEAERIAALRRQYEAFGLTIFSIQLMAEGAFDPDEAKRKRWVEEVGDRIKLARALGCSCVGMWPGGGLRGQTMEQAIERVAGSFREAGKLAAEQGLIAAFEIEPPFVFNKAEHLLAIHRAADHPSLMVIYDPSHFDLMNGSTGRPHELLRRVGVRNIGYCHLTDTDGTLRDGGTSKHLPCGDGHADIPTSLRTLREGGFAGWIMIDAWEVPDPYDACRKGIGMIKGAMG